MIDQNKTLNPSIILVDGSSYLYRAFHALPPLATSKGQPTGAIKGVLSMLKRLRLDYKDCNIIVIFDSKGKTFRDDLYENYKKNRPPMPDELKQQIQPLHSSIKAMGFPLLIIDGVEADDVIGTLAKQACQQNKKVLISTGDKDMAQLVSENIHLINTMSQTYLDCSGVENKYGVPPQLIVDLLALMGDKSDNIPGIPGIGEKTALSLLQNIGGITAIFENLDQIAHLNFRGSKKLAEKIAPYKEIAQLSYKLATIKTDTDLDFNLNTIPPEKEDIEKLKTLFKELEFKSWLHELTKTSGTQSPTSKNLTHYETILTKTHLETWLAILEKAPIFAFDTETTSLDYMEAKLVGLSFSVKPNHAAYVPLSHDYINAPKQLDKQEVLSRLKPLLEDETKKKIGHNLKYDQNILSRENIKLKGIAFDTMLESYVLNATATRHNMDTLALKYLGHQTVSFEDIAGKGVKQLTFNQIDLEKAAHYAAEDADITLQLHNKLWTDLKKYPRLVELFETIEMPLLPIIALIERTGVMIDCNQLHTQSKDLEKKLISIQNEIYEIVGEHFNLNSPKQLQVILFEKMGLPSVKKTKKGQASTAEDVLETLSLNHNLPKLILKYRSLNKLKTTYTDKLPLMQNKETGRIHTSYHQAVVATGRLSSSNPNLQNIPIKSPEGRKIRQAFIAPENCLIIAADYSQIELRVMAHLTQDEALCNAFFENKDIHRITAAEIFGISEAQVSKEQRRSAKAINFGLIYGMSAFGLAKQLNISQIVAKHYIEQYFKRYPKILNYMEETKTHAKEKGYVETLFGRRLYLPEINTKNAIKRQAAERTAINSPMQGTAADLIKKAMICVHNKLQQNPSIDARIIMQVHDELVLETHKDHVKKASQLVKQCMESVEKLSVPLVVEVNSGLNWDQAH